MSRIHVSKRQLLRTGGGLIALCGTEALLSPAWSAEDQADRQEEEVTPPEDLMREHGVLDRVLLIYEAGIRKFEARQDFDVGVLTKGGEVIRDFINNYHEKSEENYLFPRFRQAGQMVELVDTLLEQHKAGRKLTETIIHAAPQSRKGGTPRQQLVTAMRSFIAMYRPHAAREDTVLFPKLQNVVSKNEYDAMAEDFEKQEHELFGEDGFEKMVDRVAGLEKELGINDLRQFTPA